MPAPIGSAAPIYQPPPAETEIGPPPPPAPIVTLDPIHIVGDAGARDLIQHHDAATRAACLAETAKAIEGLLPMAIDVAGTVAATAAGPLAVGIGIAKLFNDSIKEGKALRELYECKKP
jgi:hypothetical protein